MPLSLIKHTTHKKYPEWKTCKSDAPISFFNCLLSSATVSHDHCIPIMEFVYFCEVAIRNYAYARKCWNIMHVQHLEASARDSATEGPYHEHALSFGERNWCFARSFSGAGFPGLFVVCTMKRNPMHNKFTFK